MTKLYLPIRSSRYLLLKHETGRPLEEPKENGENLVDKDLQYGNPVAEADQKSKNRRKFAKKLLRTTDTGII